MSYLNFVLHGTTASGLTNKWRVHNINDDRNILGWVAWYGPWRKYVFNAGGALFDAKCLREIADFCESQTKEHKAR